MEYLLDLNIGEIEKFNEGIIERLLANSNPKRMDNLQKIIRCFNDGCFDFSIYMFRNRDGITDFTSKIYDYSELAEFSNFYNSVDGDLSDAYFITEAQSPVSFVKNTDELAENIMTIVSVLSHEESKELNVFLVKTFF